MPLGWAGGDSNNPASQAIPLSHSLDNNAPADSSNDAVVSRSVKPVASPKKPKTRSKSRRSRKSTRKNNIDVKSPPALSKEEQRARNKKNPRWIGDRATEVLEEWYKANVDHPYPTLLERQRLVELAGISKNQVMGTQLLMLLNFIIGSLLYSALSANCIQH